MLISIVIATYNSEKTLLRCLNSVLYQDTQCFEILVKDGASSDNTINILNQYANNFVYYHSSPDTGVYEAWNECIVHANGDWVVFLGSDDFFINSNSLSTILPFLIQADTQNASLVYGQNLIIREEKVIQVLGKKINNPSKVLSKKMLLRHPGCFHNRLKLIEIGLYDEKFKIVGDYDLVYRLISKYQEIVYYPFAIISHVMGGLSTDPSKLELLMNEIYQMRKKNAIYPLIVVDKDYIFKKVLIMLNKINAGFIIKKIFEIKDVWKKR